MWRRLLKYTLASIGVLIGLVVVLIGTNYYFPPTYEEPVDLPGTSSVAIVQLEPMHLYLAEYKRALVLRKPGMPDQKIEMFPDTGGYSRTQLYRLNKEVFLVRGFFDAYLIDTNNHTISPASETIKDKGEYLGAFDDKHLGETKEQQLEAGGG